MTEKETSWELQMVNDLTGEMSNIKVERAQLKVQLASQAKIIEALQKKVEELEKASLTIPAEALNETVEQSKRKAN